MPCASAALLFLALVAVPAVPAEEGAAASAAGDAEQQERFADAKRFFENGKLAYDVGRFEEAALQFERAYALRPAPLLLFNMAQCHRQLGDAKKAVFLYESFLRESPAGDSPQVTVAHEELGRLRDQLAAAEPSAAPKPPPPATSTGSASAARGEEPGPAVAGEAEGEDDDLLLWGALGGGAAVAVAVGVTAAVAVALAMTPAPGDAGRIDFR